MGTVPRAPLASGRRAHPENHMVREAMLEQRACIDQGERGWQSASARRTSHHRSSPQPAVLCPSVFGPRRVGVAMAVTALAFMSAVLAAVAAQPSPSQAARNAAEGEWGEDSNAVHGETYPALRERASQQLSRERRQGTATCASIGCGNTEVGLPCNCDSMCQAFGDCCADYNSVCGSGATASPTRVIIRA